MLLLSLATQKHSPNCASQFSGEYDYIVVGAGSAGSVVAGRLSELNCVTVLLLEAGKPPPRLSEVPAVGRSFVMSDIDWIYRTTPQRFTGNGMVNRQVPWPSGKTLGGSSVINGMISVRGNKKNFDDWANQGATGWSYQEVLPYFKKLEDNVDLEFLVNGYHGKGGPVTIMQPQYSAEIKNPLIEAAGELGYRFVDPNGPTQTGFYDHQASIRRGQRCSTAKAYLVPAENRTNLDILPNSMVRKVVIENRRAVGVHFDYGGKTYEVRAKREVILSAGAVNSAQLLMLSGIGPRRHLERFGIPVVKDLPVGQTFYDHVGAIMPYEVSEQIPQFFQKLGHPLMINTYIHNRTGPLTSTEGVSIQAFLNNFAYQPEVDFPDYQVYFLEGAAIVAQLQLGMKPEVYRQIYGPYENKPFYWCISQILHPMSKGTIKLQSSNPYDPPLIDPNFFAHPKDIEDVVQGMKTCQRMAETRAMRQVGAKHFRTLHPGCEQYYQDEDVYFRCQARSVVMTLSHPTSTAKMGNPNDPTTVVDPQLRVKGIGGLRVIDASIMPMVPSGNTNIPAIMIGEKGSDMIKSTIRCDRYYKKYR